MKIKIKWRESREEDNAKGRSKHQQRKTIYFDIALFFNGLIFLIEYCHHNKLKQC